MGAMKAWRVHEFGDPDRVLRIEDVPVPEPGPGQIQIKPSVAGLNFAENLMLQGLYQMKPSLPYTAGFEVAGKVTATGADAPFQVGDRVAGIGSPPHGSLAQRSILEVPKSYPVPDGVLLESACCLVGAYSTAHYALKVRANLQAGDWVLVHAAAGSVGSACIQLAKAWGANVIATAGGPDKVAFCKAQGADVVVDYLADDFVPIVRQETSGRGADIVCDNVGGDVFDASTRCTASRGRILIIGFAGGRIADVATNRVLLKNISIVGVMAAQDPWSELGLCVQDLFSIYESGKLDPPMTFVDFADVPDTYQRIAARDCVGKYLVRIPN